MGGGGRRDGGVPDRNGRRQGSADPVSAGKIRGDIPDEPSLVGTPDGRLLITYVMAGVVPGGASCDGVADVWLNEGTGDTLAPATKVISGRVTGVTVAGECKNVKGLVLRYPAVGADAAGTTTVAFQRGGASDGSLSLGVVHRPAGGPGVRSNPQARASKARCG